MKAFPLIFSRTKNEDFVPDFLVRPADLDVKETLKYVHNTMQGLDTLNAIRYTAFAAGNYCICGGIACLSKQLVQQAGIQMDQVVDYLKDCKGRSLACFIGFAIPVPEVRSNVIPDISLKMYWNTYLEYLRHQWEALETSSETLSEPCVELNEKRFSSAFKPVAEIIGTRTVIRHFEEKPQEILDYYFNELLNMRNRDASFISSIQYRDEWDKLSFKAAAVSEQLYTTLKTSPTKSPVSAARPNSQPSVSKAPEIKTAPSPQTVSSNTPDPKKKHKIHFTTVSILLLLAAAAVVLLVIVLLIARKG